MKAFLGSEAVAAGVVPRGRLARRYRRIFPDVYLPAEQAAPTLRDRIGGAWLYYRYIGSDAPVWLDGARGVLFAVTSFWLQVLSRSASGDDRLN